MSLKKAGRESVLEEVRKNPSLLVWASEEHKDDRDIIMAAVLQDGHALEKASVARRNDHDIVLAAVQQNGCALRWASEACRADRRIVLAAVEQEERALQFAAEELLEDGSFASEVKCKYCIIKVTMMSGRSCCIGMHLEQAATRTANEVLAYCGERFGLPFMLGEALLYGSEVVPKTAV
eukprot:164232-Amphidinium_carterae.1